MTDHDREKRLGYVMNLASDFNEDEIEVLEYVAKGLSVGRTVYGPLDATGNPRTWSQEALEEVRDALVYVGAALVRLRKAGVC